MAELWWNCRTNILMCFECFNLYQIFMHQYIKWFVVCSNLTYLSFNCLWCNGSKLFIIERSLFKSIENTTLHKIYRISIASGELSENNKWYPVKVRKHPSIQKSFLTFGTVVTKRTCENYMRIIYHLYIRRCKVHWD